MVDTSVVKNLTTTIFRDDDKQRVEEKNKTERLEKRIKALSSELGNVNPEDAKALVQQAAVLDKMSGYAKDIADMIEKQSKNLQKKKLRQIKEAIMEELGIPAEFVDQLAILVKAGPEALREASDVYKTEAKKKREAAALINQEVERLDKEIKNLTNIKDNITRGNRDDMSMNDYIAKLRYEESLRDKADLVLKHVLMQLEGDEVGTDSAKV